MNTDSAFDRLGVMLDCSRNGVVSVPCAKKWIDILSSLGYNALMLYTEDTYQIREQPCFGAMRGRYSEEELREIDSYAASNGVEVIPCIQTLAHLRTMLRWPAYREYRDCEDILLAGDEKVYELIEQMFAAVTRCFRSRTVNIGMDEAHMVGRGKYYDLHGDQDKSRILLEHIRRVSQLGKKYGLNLVMWSDMFYRLATHGDYYVDNAAIDPAVSGMIPDNVQLMYWDYYSREVKRYDGMLTSHEKIKSGTWFAGGLWTWTGFAPHNGFSIQASRAAMQACRARGVRNFFLTMWGDDGMECARFAILPSLFYTAQLSRGITDEQVIRTRFEETFGISFDQFMLLDLPGTPTGEADSTMNPEKYLLYNDCFQGILDCALTGNESGEYRALLEPLDRLRDHPEWGYLFGKAHDLCSVLELKADLGDRTRKAYDARDTAALEQLTADYDETIRRLEVFYQSFRRQWFLENKPQGFEVHDIRLGGLIQRLKSCRSRIRDLLDGRIDRIEALDEKRLDYLNGSECFGNKPLNYMNSWKNTVTANVL